MNNEYNTYRKYLSENGYSDCFLNEFEKMFGKDIKALRKVTRSQ